MIELLAADDPDPRLRDKLMTYGQFVGSWSVENRELASEGEWVEQRGEWHFGWVLGGRGVQDVLFELDAPPQERGSTLRAYDEREDVWHIAWMAPGLDEFAHQIGRAEGDRIVQEGSGRRWTFSDVTADSFRWTGEKDGRLVQELHAARIA
jgi:hypothetical protein